MFTMKTTKTTRTVCETGSVTSVVGTPGAERLLTHPGPRLAERYPTR